MSSSGQQLTSCLPSKHNPFISFPSITKNAARCAKIVSADQLDTDIANNAVPQVIGIALSPQQTENVVLILIYY